MSNDDSISTSVGVATAESNSNQRGGGLQHGADTVGGVMLKGEACRMPNELVS
jgi:hypothetical protein